MNIIKIYDLNKLNTQGIVLEYLSGMFFDRLPLYSKLAEVLHF